MNSSRYQTLSTQTAMCLGCQRTHFMVELACSTLSTDGDRFELCLTCKSKETSALQFIRTTCDDAEYHIICGTIRGGYRLRRHTAKVDQRHALMADVLPSHVISAVGLRHHPAVHLSLYN